jgi:hypothetical protein
MCRYICPLQTMSHMRPLPRASCDRLERRQMSSASEPFNTDLVLGSASADLSSLRVPENTHLIQDGICEGKSSHLVFCFFFPQHRKIITVRIIIYAAMPRVARPWAAQEGAESSRGQRKPAALAGAGPKSHQLEPPPIAAGVLQTRRDVDVL